MRCIDIGTISCHVQFMKTSQLQIRVSLKQKEQIRKLAQRAGMEMSAWVMSRVLPSGLEVFQDIIRKLSDTVDDNSYIFAELNDFLMSLTKISLLEAISMEPEAKLSAFSANYLAAMVELACHMKRVTPPLWLADIEIIREPYFGSSLLGLRLYLLTHSPAPFRKRNIFIDSSLGDRV